jgi:oxygen-independent coproporphyrinogen III oxidase
MSLGLYISVPFCKTKCSYCNFASDVFSRAVFERYVERVTADINRAGETAEQVGGQFEPSVDSIYLGGGTPTILDITQLERLFVTISQKFAVRNDAEITVECAPGTLSPTMIEALLRCGVNRVSLGVQSFVDLEAASVGRLHQRIKVLEDIALLRAASIENINIDLIAGLPHQTAESWEFSLAETIATGAPHISVYMLEVDNDSRLGRELMAGGARYHAHFVPDDEVTADFYETACKRLVRAGVCQYEISNFARGGQQSQHNLKYWTRQPYLGFGVDAHSMLIGTSKAHEAVRFASPDALEDYIAGASPIRTPVPVAAALEEIFFLGLRLNRGVDLKNVAKEFGEAAVGAVSESISDCIGSGLLEREGDVIRLTPRGRLLSNEVFERFIVSPTEVLCGTDTPVRRP